MVEIDDTYLGDGVYASFDGNQIWLDLRGQDGYTKIAINSDTLISLNNFASKIIGMVQDASTSRHTDSSS